jgi:hypothetical protein
MTQGATFVSKNRMGRPATPWLASCIQNKQSGGQHVGTGMKCRRAFQDKQESFQREAHLLLGNKDGESGNWAGWESVSYNDQTDINMTATFTTSLRQRDHLSSEKVELRILQQSGSKPHS